MKCLRIPWTSPPGLRVLRFCLIYFRLHRQISRAQNSRRNRAGASRGSPSFACDCRRDGGAPPPREVTGLRGHATEMNNGGFAYLRFSAPPEVIDSLISDWMAPASPSDLSRTDHPPIRWAPPAVPPARFYRATHLRKMCDGCGSDEGLCYDPATHVAYFGRF